MAHAKIEGPSGWRLVGLACLVFILPLLAAVACAFFFEQEVPRTAAVYSAFIIVLVASPILFRAMMQRRGDH